MPSQGLGAENTIGQRQVSGRSLPLLYLFAKTIQQTVQKAVHTSVHKAGIKPAMTARLTRAALPPG